MGCFVERETMSDKTMKELERDLQQARAQNKDLKERLQKMVIIDAMVRAEPSESLVLRAGALELELEDMRKMVEKSSDDRDKTEHERDYFIGKWSACIDLIRQWPLDSQNREKAMLLYKEWVSWFEIHVDKNT
jgi:hypothetical protein